MILDELHKNIVDILYNENSAMTSMKIHNKLKKKSYSKTYQNTCKVLNTLYSKGVIIKESKNYSININWVKNEIKILERYLKPNNKNLYSDKNIKVIMFNSLFDLNDFWIKFTLNEIENNNFSDENIYWEGPNCWWLYVNLGDEEKFLNNIKLRNIGAYYLLKTKNELNKKADKYYKDRNFNSTVKVFDDIECAYIHRGIIGNKVLETKYPNSINKLFDKIYDCNEEDIFFDKISEISKLKSPIRLRIYESDELASLWKKRIKEHFD